jgi:hypothetical protein
MFKSVYLGNFKAFGPTQRIPVRPLTLIFGPNSAGKSSFLHGLLYAHEALTSDEPNNLDVKRPRLGGDSVDLGGFRQLIHKKNIANRVEWGVELDTAELEGRLAELLAPVKNISVVVTIGLEEFEPEALAAGGKAQSPGGGISVGEDANLFPGSGVVLPDRKAAASAAPRVETYLISELVGIGMQNGFDTTAAATKTTWHRLGREDRDDIQREFHPAGRIHHLRQRFTIP